MMTRQHDTPVAVIPAKAGIHLAMLQGSTMDSRFCGNDGRVICALNGKTP
jgi:hypothetical protein